MINKIDRIIDFGIFKNFVWNNVQDIEDFKEKNIFYGWNYSGKTTLSRLFNSLKNKSLHQDYANASFRISFNTGITDETNLSSFPYPVEVFNSDYIKENLRWGYDGKIGHIDHPSPFLMDHASPAGRTTP
jgi:wobble nucleotide-excising tRNase